ncbi:Heat shock protein DnaJ with tetratricopeptide repeat-containing protein [Hirschfeldia incana]|nr:Heat shock protein DnaJ with tetratricopeptide repeat-containing protein [Hirschfeldia incana]
MSPPAAAVEIGSPPVEKVSSFFNPFFPESVGSHDDQRSMDPSPSSSFHFGFEAGSGEKTKSRAKPRLVKLRKNGRKVKGSSFSSEKTPPGFNPFAPPPPSKVSVGKAFVFGGNGNSSDAKSTTPGGNAAVTPVSDEEEFSTPVSDFVFGSESTPGNESKCSDAGGGKTGREFCRKPESGDDGKARDDDSEMSLPAEMMEKLNISEEAREFCNAPPAFVFGSSGKGDSECKSAAASRPSFHSGTSNVDNFTSTTFGGDFKVPFCDPSLLKSSLFPPEIGRTPVHVRTKRLSKDPRSSKVKGKKKQHEKPNRCNDDASKEGDKPSNQFAPETPLTSLDPSHCSTNGFTASSTRDAPVFTAENSGSFWMPEISFSASTSQGEMSNKKLHSVKKYRRKVNNVFQKKNLNTTVRYNQENQPVNTGQAKQESASASVMPGECEVWRLRGNQAYKNGDMRKAEECYTHGINSSSSSESSEDSVKPLALCYGNRAAARISLGRLREAISDCDMAASLDPTYIKAFMRAANCYLVLGELGSAVQYFNKCMDSASSVCLDRRTTIESAEGVQQAQRVADYMNSASIFLEKRTPDGASDALVPITNALSISSCSEKLLQMKAEAMLMIRRYKEVIELCENTLETAERNYVSAGPDGMINVDGIGPKHHSLMVWRWNMISRSHFYLGNLETALDTLEKLQQVGSSRSENQEECRDSPASLVATISELLRYKNAGNEAVRAGKYTEAVEQYTAALSRNVDSRPFAAICFCNRAAANQALVQIADAIADCSLAMALDENYTKAVSRRATLHEMIRDYDQAASDLKRLISILAKQNGEKTKTSETSADRSATRKELKQARQRLSVMEEKSKEGIALDFFLIMGVKASDTAADIKKAYRKAALRHHPDKAAQILVRSESEGPWLKEILEEVHKGADRLFKTIGEAYSVLSDPTKRSDYELEEEIRKAKASRESYRSRKSGEASTTSPYQTSPGRRYWRHSERTYRSTPTHWW